jgi:hypothetical protein
MIEKIIIISLFVFGYCCTFWEGMIFEKVGDWIEKKLPEYICKPLFACFICATFWVGSLLYWIVWADSLQDWFITVVSAMGLNAVLSKLFKDD